MLVLTAKNLLHVIRLAFLDGEAEVCCLLYSLTLNGQFYLTIRLRARVFYEQIVNEVQNEGE